MTLTFSETPDIAVLGGGLAGRLFTWRAARSGLRVALYEAGGPLGEDSAAWAAAGMITPASEAAEADSEIVAMGRHSLTVWPRWLAELPIPVFYRQSGTLLLWHREDAGEATRFQSLLSTRDPHASFTRIDAAKLNCLEPAIGTRFPHALHILGDAQIDNRQLLHALAIALEDARIECHWHTLVSDDALPKAHTIIDCRGMGARPAWPQLRGVRGEIARLHAPEIELNHMLRLLHSRYAVYVAPRPEGRLVVGATAIESEDRSGVSVRGALELLSSAYSMLPALAEARILEFATQVRPALPDNRPAISFDPARRILRINGLYRHGFLLSPTVVEEALTLLANPGHQSPWPCLRESQPHLTRHEEAVCLSS